MTTLARTIVTVPIPVYQPIDVDGEVLHPTAVRAVTRVTDTGVVFTVAVHGQHAFYADTLGGTPTARVRFDPRTTSIPVLRDAVAAAHAETLIRLASIPDAAERARVAFADATFAMPPVGRDVPE